MTQAFAHQGQGQQHDRRWCACAQASEQLPRQERAEPYLTRHRKGKALCVVLPCHRVVASSGALTAYSGLAAKEYLLALESRS